MAQERLKGAYSMTKIRGGRTEELPHSRGQGRQLRGATPIQGVVAAREQEGPEELLHVQGQEGWP